MGANPIRGFIFINHSEGLNIIISFLILLIIVREKQYREILKELFEDSLICKENIKEVVETINTKKVIPIHTEHPEVFKDFTKSLENLNCGQKLNF